MQSVSRGFKHCSLLGRFDLLKIALILSLLGGASAAHAQASFAATRTLDVQVGGLYINANSDYSRSRFNGYGIYGDVDFKHHFGVEGAFHYISDQDSYVNIYERTYEVGGRYVRHYGRFSPYAKVMYGRGVFNYPENTANLAYNLVGLGAGTDIRVLRHLNGRVDYEYQKWFSFAKDASSPRSDSLTPNLLSAGFAYHF